MAKEGRAGRVVAFRLNGEEDLLEGVRRVASERGVRSAVVIAIGSLRRAILGFHEEERQEYREIRVEGPLELASCTGFITTVGGAAHVHLHGVVGDERGATASGHVLKGCEVGFTVEGVLIELESLELTRKAAESGLMLLDV